MNRPRSLLPNLLLDPFAPANSECQKHTQQTLNWTACIILVQNQCIIVRTPRLSNEVLEYHLFFKHYFFVELARKRFKQVHFLGSSVEHSKGNRTECYLHQHTSGTVEGGSESILVTKKPPGRV